MNQLHVTLRFLPALLLLPAITFAAEVTIEQIPAAQTARHISFHAKDVTPEQAINQFAKAAGISMEVTASQGNQPQGPAPSIEYDIDINDLPLDSALDRLGKILSLQMQATENDDSFRVLPYSPSGYYNPYTGGQLKDGPLRIFPQAVSRNTTFPANPGNPASLQVDFRIEGGGSQFVMGQPRPILDEATDDQGKSLSPPNANRMNYNNSQLLRIGQFGMNVSLKCPEPPPKKIAHLKGKFQFMVPSSYTRITFTGLKENIPAKATFNGYELQVEPKRNGNQWQIAFQLHRDAGVSRAQWDDPRDSFPSAFMQSHVTGADGKSFNNRGGSMWGGSKDMAHATMNIGRDSGPDSSPDKLIWQTVDQTTPLEVPFEATDLPVP